MADWTANPDSSPPSDGPPPDVLDMPDDNSNEAMDRAALKNMSCARTDIYMAIDCLAMTEERHRAWITLQEIDELRWRLKRRIG